jgi:hypothetical protein
VDSSLPQSRRVSISFVSPQTEVRIMGKGNNSQNKEKKKPKKGAKVAPVKPAPPPKKK